MKENMKDKIYNYIEKIPECTSHEIAENLAINEIKVVEILEELSEEYRITQHVCPLGNVKDPDCSCFYCVI
ncbi:hypothetical protein [Faecalibacterium sp. An122]|uniref:hypothetical protein n=1 Tax=Faecalibacterium sp. An122 TaxID=1965551 RepID=UPI00117B0A1C|nr:hypothetical protein [Faecalibacterium sp. An122]